MENKRKLIYGFVAAIALAIVWVVVTIPKPPTAEDAKKTAVKYMEYNDQTLSEEKDGKLVWELHTKRSVMNINTHDAEFFDITAKFYSKDGKTVTVVAPHGTYTDKTKDITIDKKVKATSSDGAVLTSEKVTWVAKKEILSALGNAKLVNNEYEVTADRIESHTDFKEFRAAGRAVLKQLKKSPNGQTGTTEQKERKQ